MDRIINFIGAERMLDKKFLFTVILSMATVWSVQWYFGRNLQQSGTSAGPVSVAEQQGVPNQPAKVLSAQDFYRPLDNNVIFNQEQEPVELSTIETPYVTAVFSNQGGTLSDISFKRYKGRDGSFLRTVSTDGIINAQNKYKACFLLAFEEKTPLTYKKINDNNPVSVSASQDAKICYRAENDLWIVEKIYTIHGNNYKIDLEVTVSPKSQENKGSHLRLFVPAPVVTELVDDTIGIVSLNKTKDALEKFELEKAEGLAWPLDMAHALFGIENKYFVHTLVHDSSRFVQRSYIKQSTIPATIPGGTSHKEAYAIFESGLITEKKTWGMSFYIGPKVLEHLVAVDDRLDDLMSFGWLSWLCKLLLKLLEYLFSFLGNYGLAILCLALVLRIPLIPLSVYSRRKMEIYQKFQPTIQKIRLKYRHDIKVQHEELMKFHQSHNLSTATPVLGCLPMLLQLPILFSLFRVLGNYLNLYNAPLYGWIIDLSTKDPYYVLPVLMGASMLWQQLMTPTTDGKQRVVMVFMTLLFTVFFAKAAAGLVLYWLVNNVVTICEDYLRKFVYRS